MKFRKIFLQAGKVDPFPESITIASACSQVYRKNFLREDTIGLIPYDGYTRVNNNSQKCVKWLLWEEKSRDCETIQAGRSRQYVLKEGLRVRGYLKIREDAGIIFQFHRCFFHGCPRCFPNDHDKILTNNLNFQEHF